MSENTREIGRAGENIACGWLEKNGFVILRRNYFTSHGEIDIIAEDDRNIAFIEVKLRAEGIMRKRYGRPACAVDLRKRQAITFAASEYLRENRSEKPPRLDVIEITLETLDDGFAAAKINHIKGAFFSEGDRRDGMKSRYDNE